MKPRLVLLLALSVATASLASADDGSKFRMGVRGDARPFVFRNADGSHSGFLYDICVAAARSAMDPAALIYEVPVTASSRFEALRADPPLDLLCDPTTVTQDRIEKYTFTPIVFFANSTLLKRNDPRPSPVARVPEDCDSSGGKVFLVGFVEGTTAVDTIVDARNAGVLAAAEGGTICEEQYPSHDAAVRDICSDDGALSYYVGDADIISAQVEEMRRQELPCNVSFDQRIARPEPYGLVIGDKVTDERRHRLIAGLYEFFGSDELQASFAYNFGGRRMASSLETLFSIYRLPGGSESE